MALVFIRLDDRTVLHVGGEEAPAFLQGLITNDMASVREDAAMLAALLSPQGKFQFDFFISRDGQGYLLETEKERLPALQRTLSLYKLRSKVTLTPLPELPVYAVIGDGASAMLGLPEQRGAARREERAEGWWQAYVDPRHAPLGLRLLASGPTVAEAFFALHGIKEASHAFYEERRLRDGIPEGSKDAVIDRTLLLENGYDVLGGISFTKGCYVGQEVTARSKHRAVLRKRLYQVSAEAMLPPSGTALTAGGREIGELRSTAGDIGLALVRADLWQGALTADETVQADGVAVRIRAPFWHAVTDGEVAG